MNLFANVHSHLLNFAFIPDDYYKTRVPFSEIFFRSPIIAWLIRMLTWLFPGSKWDRSHEMLKLFKQNIHQVAAQHVEEMKAANILFTAPLMMDVELASFGKKPEIPFVKQVELISGISLKYAGKFLPFIAVDPRRERAADMVEEALEEMGFLGVKFYPPMGYHPSHKSVFNSLTVNEELQRIYTYCHQNQVPITAHCSIDCAYGKEFINNPERLVEVTHPGAWRPVLSDFPQLILNFAHFGGDFPDVEKPESWSSEILRMIDSNQNVYTDLSYHGVTIDSSNSEQYFWKLSELMDKSPNYREKILFGTDWPMTRHTLTEAEYITLYIDELGGQRLEELAYRNVMNFLFPDHQIPRRILRFYEDSGKILPEYLTDYFG